MKNIFLFTCLVAAMSLSTSVNAQGLLKKLKDKAAKTVENAIDKKTGTSQDTPENNSGNNNTGNNNNSNNNAGKPSNKGGGGLSNTEPPDVTAQIAEAEAAHTSKNYSEARFSLQQALQGVEIQLGRQILKSLPPAVSDVPADTTQDKVMSTQWGWNNLTIHRVYRKDDKQMTVTIGNNGVYAGVINAYYANAGVIQASEGKQNIKQVRVKGNKAIIQYDDASGYSLAVQLGQTAMVVFECINFSNEQEVMAAANSIDIEGIKKLLGEQ